MKIARCRLGNEIFYAAAEGDLLRRIEGDIFGDFTTVGAPLPMRDVTLLAPVLPSKVVAVGKNYLDHVRELGGPEPQSIIIFMKPPTSVIGPGEPVVIPRGATRVDYEGELAFVIKRTARCVPAADADRYILGYTCLNDVTERDQQKSDGQWTRAKGYDSFCPIGPFISDELSPDDCALVTRLNGRVVQSSNTRHMKWKARDILEFVTACMTLNPGDVVSTGTPAGIGPLSAGDTVAVELEGIGRLENPVVGYK